MRIAVTGGRDHLPTRAEIQVFLRLWRELGGTELHHGDARGVDGIYSTSALIAASVAAGVFV